MVHDSHTYLEITQPGHPVFKYTPDTQLLPFGGRLRVTENAGALQPLGSYIPAFPIYPPEFSWIREKAGKRLFMPENWKAVPGWYIFRRILTAAMPDTIYRITAGCWRAR